MTWISVVLVIAVGMFLLRDNIAKFINNAATQIAGEESEEESRPEGMNEYGFYFGKQYENLGANESYVFHEDGSMDLYMEGHYMGGYEAGSFTYSDGVAKLHGTEWANFSNNGESGSLSNGASLMMKGVEP